MYALARATDGKGEVHLLLSTKILQIFLLIMPRVPEKEMVGEEESIQEEQL